MKTTMKLVTALMITLALPLGSNAHEAIEIDPAVQYCYGQFQKVSNFVDVGSLFSYRFGLGHQLGFCLQDNGLNQAVNQNVSGGQRIVELSKAIGQDLPEFNRIVLSVLKRP